MTMCFKVFCEDVDIIKITRVWFICGSVRRKKVKQGWITRVWFVILNLPDRVSELVPTRRSIKTNGRSSHDFFLISMEHTFPPAIQSPKQSQITLIRRCMSFSFFFFVYCLKWLSVRLQFAGFWLRINSWHLWHTPQTSAWTGVHRIP